MNISPYLMLIINNEKNKGFARCSGLIHFVMKVIRRILIVATVTMIISGAAYSQSFDSDYKYALGLRAGGPSGITFKFRNANDNSIEFIAGFWADFISLTALFEKNTPAFDVDGMIWYYGGGGHVSFFTNEVIDDRWYYRRGDGFALGIDGIVGLEYKIPPIPFAVSLDLKPFLEVDRGGDVHLGIDPGLGIKFTF